MDEAKVCKHCGRDLVSTSTAQKVEIVQPAQKTGCFTWLVAIFFGLVFMGWCASVINPRPSTAPGASTAPAQPAKPAEPPLSAEVSFTGTQFVISNTGADNWDDVTLMIDPGVLSDGFSLEVAGLGAKKQYSVGALQFADGDGKRFNPLQQKPRRFRIRAHVGGQLRFWSGGFK